VNRARVTLLTALSAVAVPTLNRSQMDLQIIINSKFNYILSIRKAFSTCNPSYL